MFVKGWILLMLTWANNGASHPISILFETESACKIAAEKIESDYENWANGRDYMLVFCVPNTDKNVE